MATVPVLRGNDENVRPDNVNGPNDEDRERFGFFTKRKSRVERQSSAGSLTARPDRNATPLAPRPDTNAGPLTARSGSGAGLASSVRGEGAAAAPVALVPLVDSTLGDQEATLRLLRTRPAAPKYDFKGRINELTDHNRALRAALIEERERRKQLADVLSRSEADINTRLRAVAGEADECRRRLDTQGKLEKMVQEAVRSVWREETGAGHDPATAKRGDEAPHPVRLEVAELQAQLEALRQCSASEASRALRAELLLREREEELARTKQQLQELQANSVREGKALTRARSAAQLVRDAGGLLQQQKEEYDEKFKMLSVMAQQREEELATELSKAASRCKALEQQLSKCRA